MVRRFFSETRLENLTEVTLAGTEAHHLIHVLRGQAGESIELFDGHGAAYSATIQHVGRKEVTASVETKRSDDRELPVELLLAVALPRGDRQDWLVQKLVEVGVAKLVPLTTERSVAQPKSKSLLRHRRGVIEASKQCRRNCLMEIAEPHSFDDFVKGQSLPATRWKLMAHFSNDAVPPNQLFVGETTGRSQRSEHSRPTVVILVGPEGGLTDGESDSAVQLGWTPIDLGPTVLRTETAAVVSASQLAMLAGYGRASSAHDEREAGQQ